MWSKDQSLPAVFFSQCGSMIHEEWNNMRVTESLDGDQVLRHIIQIHSDIFRSPRVLIVIAWFIDFPWFRSDKSALRISVANWTPHQAPRPEGRPGTRCSFFCEVRCLMLFAMFFGLFKCGALVHLLTVLQWLFISRLSRESSGVFIFCIAILMGVSKDT